MKSEKKRILSKIITAAVFSALLIVAFFQYNWAAASAAADITEGYLALSRSIESRLALDLNNSSIYQDKPDFISTHMTPEQILEEIEELYRNSEESLGGSYIKSITRIQDEDSLEFSVYQKGNWILQNNLPSELRGHLERILGSPEPMEAVVHDVGNSGMVWVFYPLLNQKIYICLQYDLKSLYRDKIHEYSQLLFSGYTVEILDNLPQGTHILDGPVYRYSPFRRERWVFPLHYSIQPLPREPGPGNMTPRVNTNLGSPQRNHPINGVRPGNSMSMNPNPGLFMDILVDGVPFITHKENSLTLQWILMLILLIGIGGAYFFILAQAAGLRKIRNREKEFIAGVTHELRTPLTVIQSAADNMEKGIISPKRIEQYGSLITEQSLRLTDMIEGMLMLSRLEGKQDKPPELQRVLLSDVEKNLLLYSQSLMKLSGNEISIDFSELPKSVISDRETIELVLTNLISNSNKHAYPGDSRGSIWVKGSLGVGDNIFFKVEDQGIGIKQSELDSLFEPFFRGTESTNHQVKGAGLGLFITSRKVEHLGGTIGLERKSSKGAIFTVQLPCKREVSF